MAGGDPLSRWLEGEGRLALDALLAKAPDVIGVIDWELTLRYVNWTAPGLTQDSVIGRNALTLLRPEHLEIGRSAYLHALRSGEQTRFEMVYRDEEGIRQWEIRLGPIHAEGKVIGLIAVTSDVTEQRRAHADRDRFFSLSLDMLVVTGPEGRFKRLNPAFGEALELEVSALLGTPFIDLVHPDDRPLTYEVHDCVVQGEPILDFENRYRRADGTYRTFSWRATRDPVTGDVYAVARDITDQRSTEAQLRQAQKMEAVGQLAGGVAHDFNNLLQAILANNELAQQLTEPGTEVSEHLGEIDHAAQRAAALTKQLLTFSRRRPLNAVAVDLNQLIRGLMQMLRRLLPESIRIDWLPGQELGSVSVDPSQLEQVIVNLCVNARDAMEQGGRLVIQTESVIVDSRFREMNHWAKHGRYALLTVSDDGAGMSAEVRERAFEPFFTTKGPHRGTGLGLSTVYGIVRQHDGMVHLESQPGIGTTLKLYLPSDQRLAPGVAGKLEARTARGTETILVGEDDEQVRLVLVRVLERAGYRALAAQDGSEAIRLLREAAEPIHLVLLDVVMPELGGVEAWSQIEALRPGLRVLFATGHGENIYRRHLPPNSEVLDKPFRPEELLRRVRMALDRTVQG
ncbi:MAG: PAS domain-containing protein [Myxococcota bacterium]|nr:PAS domain-containing protein [Myxococcota bacterium]